MLSVLKRTVSMRRRKNRLDETVKHNHVLTGGQVNNRIFTLNKELLAIRRIFSLVGMITNTKFSNCPNVFKICVVWQ